MRASDRGQKPQFICQGSLNHPKQLQTHQVWIPHGLRECQWCHLFEMIQTCVRHEIHITIQVYVLKLSFQAFGIYSLHSGLSQFCPPQGFLGMPLCLCTVFRSNLNIWQKRKVTSDTCLGKKMFQTTSLEWNLNVLYNYKENKVFSVGLSTCREVWGRPPWYIHGVVVDPWYIPHNIPVAEGRI